MNGIQLQENNGGKLRKLLFNEISLIFATSGMVLSAFIYLTSPQQKQDTAIELLKAQAANQQETIQTITKTQQNDTQELKSEVAGLRAEVQQLRESVVKLSTIIEERIPKK
jgi:uncharacterized protein YlxW (UPF0749 family)